MGKNSVASRWCAWASRKMQNIQVHVRFLANVPTGRVAARLVNDTGRGEAPDGSC